MTMSVKIRMRRAKTIVVMAAVVLVGMARPAAAQDGTLPGILPEDRVLIIVPHPDDETIGTAGVIQNAVKNKSQLKIVWLTNGDSNEYAFLLYKKRPVFKRKAVLRMGKLRMKEALEAMRVLGVREDRLTFLGYPDYGTMTMFKEYWGETERFKSVLTRVRAVPYMDSPSYRKPYVGESILDDLVNILTRFKPTKIFVTLSSDANVDHQAAFLFVQVAAWETQDVIGRPEIYSYLVHSPRWPAPKGYRPDLGLEPPRSFKSSSVRWFTLGLDQEQVETKRQAVSKYHSQMYNPGYLLAFARKNELFGQYPLIKLAPGRTAGTEVNWDALGIEVQVESQIFDEEYTGGKTIDGVLYAATAGQLHVKIKSPSYKSRLFGVNLFLFGYRKDRSFSEMPKLRFHFQRPNKVVVYDKRHPVMLHEVEYRYKGSEIELSIPLKLLDDPEYILTSVSSWLRGISQETTAWRILDMTPAKAEE